MTWVTLVLRANVFFFEYGPLLTIMAYFSWGVTVYLTFMVSVTWKMAGQDQPIPGR